MDKIKTTQSNDDFLAEIAKGRVRERLSVARR